MEYLSSFEFDQGIFQQECVVLKKDGISQMMDYAWMDPEDLDLHTLENDGGIAHGTSILKYLCLTWANN